MARSGSTWQYQVACDLLERTGPGERLGFLTPPEFARVSAIAPAGNWRIFKTHDGHAAFAEVLAAGQARGLYTYRDLRDVAYSLAHKWSVPLRTAVIDRVGVRNCIANHHFWTSQPHVFVQRYEDWVKNPATDVARIAAHLGVELLPQEAEQIADRYSFEENRRRTEAVADELRAGGVDLTDPRNTLLSDPNSLLHWNHLRSGEVGGWRANTTLEDLSLLAQECGEWLAENGYEDHPAWTALRSTTYQNQDLARELAETRLRLEESARRAEGLADSLDRLNRELGAVRSELHEVRSSREQFEQAHTQLQSANHQLHATVADLQRHLDAATRTLDGAWSCLPHRLVRWFRALLDDLRLRISQRAKNQLPG